MDPLVIGRCGIHVFRDRVDARAPCFVCATAMAESIAAPAISRFVLNPEAAEKAAKRKHAKPQTSAVGAPFGKAARPAVR